MSEEMTKPQRSLNPKMIVGAVLVVLAVVFVLQNTEKRKIDVFFWHLSMPAWIWLLVLLAVGIVIGSIFPWLRPRKKKD